jgi:hypothetical protein
MRSRRVVSCGLIAGMSMDAIRRSPPGYIMDLYMYRQDYDMSLHGMRRKKAGE